MTVCSIFVLVDGVAHLPQVVAQLSFFLPLGLKAGQRNDRGRKNGKDRNRDDQLDQGQPRLGGCYATLR
jgi:hypothetical protein